MAWFCENFPPDGPRSRADLLDRLLARLENEPSDLPLVFVGDYMDRGEHSARVLATLHALERTEV